MIRNMENKHFSSFVSLSIALIISLLIIALLRYRKNNISLVNSAQVCNQKNNYLLRCIEYRDLINEDYILNTVYSEYIVYFTGESCLTCAESLLLLLTQQYGLGENILVLVDNPKKEEMVINFNDGFREDVQLFTAAEHILMPINHVLLMKVDNGKISYIFEYKPEEKNVFKEYFEYFIFSDFLSE